MQLGASGGLGAGQVRFEAAPFGVGEVGLVCFSHARHPTERVLQNPFSDGFNAKFAERHFRAPPLATKCGAHSATPGLATEVQSWHHPSGRHQAEPPRHGQTDERKQVAYPYGDDGREQRGRRPA
jgi:hypothetical protein